MLCSGVAWKAVRKAIGKKQVGCFEDFWIMRALGDAVQETIVLFQVGVWRHRPVGDFGVLR